MVLHLLNIRAYCCHSHLLLHKEDKIEILSTAKIEHSKNFLCDKALLEHPLKYIELITSLCQKSVILPLSWHHPVIFYMYQ